jgi:hypothetical protein
MPLYLRIAMGAFDGEGSSPLQIPFFLLFLE